jgi:hypothetical protein
MAATSGNTDYYEANDSVSSPWWQGTSRPVTQRYGCTYLPPPKPEEPGPGWCPGGQWHQGIDIGTSGVSIPLSSAVDGTVADWVYTTCLAPTCQTLGYLAIRTNGGNVVYLLHGSPTTAFATSPKTVHINDNVYTTGANGYSIGYHLHLEVHASVVGGLYNNPGPGDDINPEGWLFRIPGTYGQQLTSWSAGDLGEFANAPPSLPMMSSAYNPPTSWGGSWTPRRAPYLGRGYDYLLTDPVVVSQSPNEWDAFAITVNGNLAWWSYAFGPCVWTELAPPPFLSLTNGLSVVTRTAGYLDVFALATDGHIYHVLGVSSGGCAYSWGAWSSLGGTMSFTSDIVVVSANDNNIYLVARDTGTSLWWTHFEGYAWATWAPVPDISVQSGLTAIAWNTGLEVFARSTNGHIYDRAYSPSNGWQTAWQTDVDPNGAFAPTSQFSAVSWATFRIDFFIRDAHYDVNDGWLWHAQYLTNPLRGNPGWSGYSGQNFYAPPNFMLANRFAVVANGYPHIDIVGQATADRTNYAYWHLCFCNNTWDALPSGP